VPSWREDVLDFLVALFLTQPFASVVTCPRTVKGQAVLSQKALAGLCWSIDTTSCRTLSPFLFHFHFHFLPPFFWHSFLDLQSPVPGRRKKQAERDLLDLLGKRKGEHEGFVLCVRLPASFLTSLLLAAFVMLRGDS
jgi:hypothetical protein